MKLPGLILLDKLNKNIGQKDTELGEAIDLIIELFEALSNSQSSDLDDDILALSFVSSNYTGVGAMSWTVPSAGLLFHNYIMLSPSLMLMQWGINNSTLAGVATNNVRIMLPDGYAVKKVPSHTSYNTLAGWGNYFNATWNTHFVQATAGNNYISLFKNDASNYALGQLQTYGGILLNVEK